MSRSPPRVNAVTAVKVGSDQDRVAKALYEHDAMRATAVWPTWKFATRPKKILYLDRAAVAIGALQVKGPPTASSLSTFATPDTGAPPHAD